ncbi:two-component regulator propeller domain-containing protein [Candidatus Omnitrophota bacterium]
MVRLTLLLVFCFSFVFSSLLHGQDNWKTYDERDNLRDNTVVSIAIDHNNVKWFGHGTIGVTKYNEKHFVPVVFKDYGVKVIVDKDNVKWFSGFGSLYSYDDTKDVKVKKEHPYFYKPDSHGGWITSLIVDENNILWVGTISTAHQSRAVIRYDRENINLFLIGVITTFSIDENNQIWAGGRRLYYFREGEWHNFITGQEIIDNNSFFRIAFDKNNILWAAIWEGDHGVCLASYDGINWTIYTTENAPLLNININVIEVDQNNTKWIGTDSGVSRFDGETWTTFTIENSGLADNKVNAIAVEKNNTIWFGTDNGVSKYTGEVITTSVDEEETKPEILPLIKSYPNPFNPTTTIEFELPETGMAALTIYNIAGQKVRDLLSGYKSAGMHRVVWDGRDESGNAVSAGVYIAWLKAGDVAAVGKMVLVR